MKFSERYGYVKPVDVLKRETLENEGIAGICTCYDQLASALNHFDVNCHNRHDESYSDMEEAIWCIFLNKRKNDFWSFHSHQTVATEYLLSKENAWYLKFDLIEFSIKALRSFYPHDRSFQGIVNSFVHLLNSTLKRLNYAYRIVDDQIVEITDEEEIKTIEEAVEQSSSIKTHLSDALKHISSRPVPDYRNSIKESITAVEALCRDITGENTLGAALKKLEKNGITIPTALKSGIEKLYVYTNDEKTGIRHALMDETDTPEYEEAKFMLVACSAFINYIQGKRSN